MRRSSVIGAVAIFAFAGFFDAHVEGGKGNGTKRSVAIKAVMKSVQASGLWMKVANGSATRAEKKQVIAGFQAMAASTPPKGAPANWQAKTTALVAAAQSGNGAALRQANNCAACHAQHR
jgi:hypothetical protein